MKSEFMANSHRSRKLNIGAESEFGIAVGGSRTVIEIADVSSDTVWQFVRFLYTGKINVTMENIPSLMILADDYKIAGIHDRCTALLNENLKDPNQTLNVLSLIKQAFLRVMMA